MSRFVMRAPTALRQRRDASPVVASSPWWWLSAVVSTVTLFVLNVIVSRTAVAPRTPWDEIGVLQMSRILAGDGPVAPMSGAGYYPGWSFIMAPIWWFTDDPEIVYRIAIWLVVAVAVATLWPLTLLGRRLGLSTPQAITVGAVALSLPARTVHADYTLSENMLAFWIAWVVVAAFAAWDRPSLGNSVLFVLAVAAAYLTHARALAVVLTAAVWLLVYARRDARLAAAGLAFLAVMTVVAQWTAEAVTSRILLSGFGQGELLNEAMSTTSPGLVARITLTHGWAQLVSSFGIVALGGVVLIVWVARELRQHFMGPACLVFGLGVSAFVVSVLWWSGSSYLVGEATRFDVWVYTRYVDPVALILVVLGLAGIVRRVRASIVLITLAVSVAIIVPVVSWVAPIVPTYGTMHGPGNAAGILHWADLLPTGQPYPLPLEPTFQNEARFWPWASLSVVMLLIVVLVLRRLPPLALGLALLVFATSSVLADPDQNRDAPAPILAAVERIEDATDAERGTATVVFDLDCYGPAQTHAQTLNWIGFWLAPREVLAVHSEDLAGTDLVVSCGDWDRADEFGALPVPGSDFYTYQLWVMPGALQQGLLRDQVLQSFTS